MPDEVGPSNSRAGPSPTCVSTGLRVTAPMTVKTDMENMPSRTMHSSCRKNLRARGHRNGCRVSNNALIPRHASHHHLAFAQARPQPLALSPFPAHTQAEADGQPNTHLPASATKPMDQYTIMRYSEHRTTTSGSRTVRTAAPQAAGGRAGGGTWHVARGMLYKEDGQRYDVGSTVVVQHGLLTHC